MACVDLAFVFIGGGTHHLNFHLRLNIEQVIAGGEPNNIALSNNTIRI